MSHPFVKETIIDRSKFGYSTPRIDRDFLAKEFADALAAAMGYQRCGADDGVYSARIDCGEGLELFIHPQHGAKMGRVEISGSRQDRRTVDRQISFPSATFDASRDLAKLAKAIERQIVIPSRDIIKQLTSLADDRAAKCDAFGKLIKEMNETFPGLSVTRNHDAELSANVYFNANGFYMSGSLSPDGHINFQRVSINGAEDARKFIALATGKAS